jgi:hypothetical protein
MGAGPLPGKSWRSLWSGIGADQARDTGLAMVLLCLLVAHFGHRPRLVPLALVLLVLTMVWPRAFRPLAGLWFGLSHLLGTVTSRIVLSILFYGLVTPMGRWRRWRGADPLQLQRWKKDDASVFQVRQGPVQPGDLEKPY